MNALTNNPDSFPSSRAQIIRLCEHVNSRDLDEIQNVCYRVAITLNSRSEEIFRDEALIPTTIADKVMVYKHTPKQIPGSQEFFEPQDYLPPSPAEGFLQRMKNLAHDGRLYVGFDDWSKSECKRVEGKLAQLMPGTIVKYIDRQQGNLPPMAQITAPEGVGGEGNKHRYFQTQQQLLENNGIGCSLEQEYKGRYATPGRQYSLEIPLFQPGLEEKLDQLIAQQAAQGTPAATTADSPTPAGGAEVGRISERNPVCWSR